MGLFSRSPAQPRSDAFTNNVDLVGITPYPAWTWPKTCKRGFTRTTAFRSSGQPCFLSDPFMVKNSERRPMCDQDVCVGWNRRVRTGPLFRLGVSVCGVVTGDRRPPNVETEKRDAFIDQ